MLLPPEIVDFIIDFVDNVRTLKACSLVSKSWVARSRVHLFREVVLFTHRRWQKIISVGRASPARYTRSLTLTQGSTAPGQWIITDILYPFLRHLQDFKNIQKLVLDGWIPSEFTEGGLKKYFGLFGPHLRSLELVGGRTTSEPLLILLGLLPNLEDLSLNQRFEGAGKNRVLQQTPKLSGCLTIRGHTGSVFPTLCKLPLRFREIRLYEHKNDYQELVNVCAETLMDFRAMPAGWGEQGHYFIFLFVNPTLLRPGSTQHHL
jgi:hypothetical protein